MDRCKHYSTGCIAHVCPESILMYCLGLIARLGQFIVGMFL